MKYALLIYSDWDQSGVPGGAREGWIDYARAAKEAGILLGAEQLAGTHTATSVRVRGGQRLLTDGPFLETKEHLGGFFLIDVPDLDTALDWAARMPHASAGTADVRGTRSGARRWAGRRGRGGPRWAATTGSGSCSPAAIRPSRSRSGSR